MQKTVTTLLLVLLSELCFCQEADVIAVNPKNFHPSFNLSEVVVSASLYRQPLMKLTKPGLIIYQRQIKENMQSNMIDALAQTPGFTQVWNYHSPIILRGMNSKRLIILQNGCRRIGNFPGGYFAQDMNIYGAQKMEIIKGAGSVIYGTGAISGIVNIINNAHTGPKQTTASSLTGYGSNNNEFLEVAQVCHRNKNFSINTNFKYRKAGNYSYADGETAENTNITDKDVALHCTYKIDKKSEIQLNNNIHYGDWGKPRGFNGPDKKFTRIRNKDNGAHTDLHYSYKAGGVIEKVEMIAYYDYSKRDYYKYKHSSITDVLASLDLVHYKNNYGGAQLFTNLKVAPNIKVTTGTDGYFFTLDNPTQLFDYYNNTQGIKHGYENAGQKSIGLFVNSNWECTSKFKLSSGIRYDRAEISEGKIQNVDGRNRKLNAVSGNIGFVYSPASTKHISFNLGRAFRVPSAEELFSEILTCKGTKKGNPDLKPEYGWNLDLGFRGTAMENHLTWDLALFYNRLYGYITEVAGQEGSNVDFTYENTDAKLMGGEISSSYRLDEICNNRDNILFTVTASHVHGIDIYKDNAPLFGVPPLQVSSEVKYHQYTKGQITKGYFISVKANGAAEQNRVAAKPAKTGGGPWGYETSSSHVTFNLGAGVNFKNETLNPKLRLAISNLLNTQYHPWGSYVPAMGRNIKLTLQFKI